MESRDSIQGVSSATNPSIVSISDIHGYVDAVRGALLTLTDHPDYDPLVTVDEQGTPHWADNYYVIVFNGDLVDRGPANDAVLALVGRLFEEAPPGHVRVIVGNHEGIMLTPQCYNFDQWYSANAPASVRKSYLEWITGGGVVAAYEGYNVTYAHAGANDYPFVLGAGDPGLKTPHPRLD